MYLKQYNYVIYQTFETIQLRDVSNVYCYIELTCAFFSAKRGASRGEKKFFLSFKVVGVGLKKNVRSRTDRTPCIPLILSPSRIFFRIGWPWQTYAL